MADAEDTIRPMTKKVDQYVPEIKDGLPPSRTKTKYDKKMVEGELIRLGERIEHGQYLDIPSGSMGKFKRVVERRGLKTVRRYWPDQPMTTVYVVTTEWLAENPEVLR
jgi:hypothetical protein